MDESIVSQLSQQIGLDDPEELRSNERRPWETELEVSLTERSDTGRQRTVKVRTCDISAGGVGFLFDTFIYIGTRIEIVFTRLNGKPTVQGTVVYCQYHDDGKHRVGVQFTERKRPTKPGG